MALDHELVEHPEIRQAARAAMRAQAHAVDIAEQLADPDLISTASHVYLDVRHREGLRPPEVRDADPFERLMADLGRAGAPAGDTSQP
jgi:hypothetical protein